MALTDIRALISEDLAAIDGEIRRQLHTRVPLIDTIAHYIVSSGGKRLRPMIVVLAARALAYEGDAHVKSAAIIEFIHTATLLHDDVVDESNLRRGRQTANSVYGNAASVLTGDFLYSRAFQMMVQIGDMQVMEVLADATNVIAEGEVQQLVNCHDPDTTEARYLEVIRHKTAKLFEAGAQLAAILGGQPAEIAGQLAVYGMRLGTAFQLRDDALDYDASAEEIGKNIGDDLAEGKPTMPLIHAIRVGTPEQVSLVRRAIETGGRDEIEAVIAAVRNSGALDYTHQRAREEADAALAALAPLPDSVYKDALASLASISVSRSH
ncbi:MAG: octaprenyl diphosphate synthase [Pseudomonadota bacterium]